MSILQKYFPLLRGEFGQAAYKSEDAPMAVLT
jgi:hypothetical protein